MMNAPDQILAFVQVDAGFSADTRIHLRQKRGGNLHIGNAAHEHRGHKSAHIAHNAAAKTNQKRSAIAAGLNHFARQALHASHGLEALADGKKERDRRLRKRAQEGFGPQRPNLRRGEHEHAPRQPAYCALDARSEGFEQAAARKYVVSCRRRVYVDGLHGDSMIEDSRARVRC